MYEGEPDEEDEELPVFVAKVGNDGGLRGDWMDTAEFIAGSEERIALWWRNPISRGWPFRDGDHTEPAFLYLGDSESLTFIAAMATGIIKHGPAFTFWVREMGNGPNALEEFEKVFLGHWKSAAEFAQHVLDERVGSEQPERGDEDDSGQDLEMDARAWVQDLQRRGEINVVPNPQGGVWVFRGW